MDFLLIDLDFALSYLFTYIYFYIYVFRNCFNFGLSVNSQYESFVLHFYLYILLFFSKGGVSYDVPIIRHLSHLSHHLSLLYLFTYTFPTFGSLTSYSLRIALCSRFVLFLSFILSLSLNHHVSFFYIKRCPNLYSHMSYK